MLITVTFLLTLGTIAADIFVWLRRVRRSGSALRRRLFAAWCILSDLLPFAIAVVNWTSSDNTTPVMSFSMWCFWLYLLLVLPRLLYYVFRLCRLPRVGAVAGVALAAALVWGATYGRTKLGRQPGDGAVGAAAGIVRRLPRGAVLRRACGVDGASRTGTTPIGGGTQRPAARCGALLRRFGQHPLHELTDSVRRILSGLKAPCGVYSVTGNHDVGVYIRDTLSLPADENLRRLVAAQRSMGWYVLEDTTAYLVRGGDSIALTGISFDKELQEFRHSFHLPTLDLSDAYRGVPDSLFNITLSHLPQLWPNITALRPRRFDPLGPCPQHAAPAAPLRPPLFARAVALRPLERPLTTARAARSTSTTASAMSGTRCVWVPIPKSPFSPSRDEHLRICCRHGRRLYGRRLARASHHLDAGGLHGGAAASVPPATPFWSAPRPCAATKPVAARARRVAARPAPRRGAVRRISTR